MSPLNPAFLQQPQADLPAPGTASAAPWDRLMLLSQFRLPSTERFAPLPEDYWDPRECSWMLATGQAKVQTILQWVGAGLTLDIGCNDGAIAKRIVL